MSRSILMLLVVLFHSSSAILDFQVFIDPLNCVNLKCWFRGIGEHCNPVISQKEAFSMFQGTIFEFLNKQETDSELFNRLERQYPMNTFTLKEDPALYEVGISLNEKCEEKVLICNSVTHFLDDDANQFMKRFVKMSPERKPKFNC